MYVLRSPSDTSRETLSNARLALLFLGRDSSRNILSNVNRYPLLGHTEGSATSSSLPQPLGKSGNDDQIAIESTEERFKDAITTLQGELASMEQRTMETGVLHAEENPTNEKDSVEIKQIEDVQLALQILKESHVLDDKSHEAAPSLARLAHRRSQEEKVLGACHVLNCEVEVQKALADIEMLTNIEMLSIEKHGERVKAEALKAVSDMIDEEQRKGLIQAELTNATSQLKEVVAESARTLAEAARKERDILRIESEETVAKLKNADRECRSRQEALVKQVVQQAESRTHIDQYCREHVQAELQKTVSYMIGDENPLSKVSIQAELIKSISQLKEVVVESARSLSEVCHKERDALRSDSDEAVMKFRNFVDCENRLRHEALVQESRKAASDQIDQEHRFLKDLIQAELTKGISQLKEVVVESARSLSEVCHKERDALKSDSDEAVMKFRNFVDCENCLRHEALVQESRKAVSDQIDQEHRLLKDELTKGISQLKEVVVESARSLSEVCHQERDALKSESDESVMKFQNLVDCENRLRHDVLVQESRKAASDQIDQEHRFLKDLIQAELTKSISQLKEVVVESARSLSEVCHKERDALKSESDESVMKFRNFVDCENRLRHEALVQESCKAASDQIDQEHRLLKDLIQAELTKGISQLKEVVVESAKTLAEVVPTECEILRNKSEEAAIKFQNFLDNEYSLWQDALVLSSSGAKRDDSQARFEQQWCNQLQEEVAQRVTLSLANFEERFALLESQIAVLEPSVDGVPTVNHESTSFPHIHMDMDSCTLDMARTLKFEMLVESGLTFGAKAASLEARTTSLEQQVKVSAATIAASLDQQDQDVATLCADVARLCPLIQEVSEIRNEVTKLRDVLLLEQTKQVKSLVEQDLQNCNLAPQDQGTKCAQAHDKLQLICDEVGDAPTSVGASSMDEVRAQIGTQTPLENTRLGQQDQKSRWGIAKQALEDGMRNNSGLTLIQGDVKQLQNSLKEEIAARSYAVGRLETSINRIGRRTSTLQQLIMHGTKAGDGPSVYTRRALGVEGGQ